MSSIDTDKPDVIQSRQSTEKRDETSSRIVKLEGRLKRLQNDLYSIAGELKSIRKTV